MIPFSTLLRIAVRTLFIQAGFSPEAMQALGLLYALEPAWPYLYPDPEQRQEAVRRHLTPFNTHPYAAAALVGGILFHETRLARGEGTAEEVVQLKRTLMGPLAALGDGFYWLSLRPVTAAISVALVPVVGPWAALVFVVAYNVVHLVTRAWLFVTGYRYGSAMVTRISALRVPVWSGRLRALTALLAGGLGAWLASSLAVLGGSGWLLGAGCAAWCAFCVWMLERKVAPLAVLYGSGALATLVGALW